jgi:hypothetical protein
LKQYVSVILFVIFAILLAAVYTYIIQIKSQDQLWNWWHSLIATLVSVLLGVSVAIGIFFYQNNVTQNEEKGKFIFLLDTELAATWQALQSLDNPLNINFEGKTYSFHVGFLQSIILEEAARSGLFNKEETRMLLKLARYINFHNMDLNLLISIIPQTRNDSLTQQKIIMVWNAHVKTRNEILKDLQLASKQFKLESLNERIKMLPPQ